MTESKVGNSRFKVGDRVVFYTGRTQMKTEVLEIDPDGYLLLRDHDRPAISKYVAHPRQCRKLIKKERRRVWLVWNPGKREVGFAHYTYATREGAERAAKEFGGTVVEFIEVRKRK